MPDWYEVLQVSPNAEPEVIGVAYRRLSRKYHPDVDPSPEAAKHQRLLNDAYEVLTDPERRSEFDRQRQRRPPAEGPRGAGAQSPRSGPSGPAPSGAAPPNTAPKLVPRKADPRWLIVLLLGAAVIAVSATALCRTNNSDDTKATAVHLPTATPTSNARSTPSVVAATATTAVRVSPTPAPQVPHFINTSKGSPNGANAFSDPAAFCDAVGTADPRLSGAAYRFIDTSNGSSGPVKLANGSLYMSVAWRCWDGKLLACEVVGAAGQFCGLVDMRTEPSSELVKYCAENHTDLPDGQVPYAITGHMNAFDWRCRGARPVIVSRLIAAADIDTLGYVLGVWYAVE